MQLLHIKIVISVIQPPITQLQWLTLRIKLLSFTLAAKILDPLQLPVAIERSVFICPFRYFTYILWKPCSFVRGDIFRLKVLKSDWITTPLTIHLFLSALWHQPCSQWGTTWCLEVTIAPSRCGTWRTWDLQLLPFAQTRPLIGKSCRLGGVRQLPETLVSEQVECLFLESSGKLRNCIPQHLDILKGISKVRLLNQK